ncbi:MAG: hypothetical protein ACMUIS_09640, partial [bacterium]
MDNLDMDEKEKEIAATNRLLDIIRGEKRGGTPPPAGSLQPASVPEGERQPKPSLLDAGEEHMEAQAKAQGPAPSLPDAGEENAEIQNAPVPQPAASGVPTPSADEPEQKRQAPKHFQDEPPTEPHAPEEKHIPRQQPPVDRHMPAERPAPLLKGQSALKKERPPHRKVRGLLDRWLRRHERKAIGLDIGSRSLKFVLLQKGIAGLKLLDYRIMELPPGGEG